MNVDVPVSVIVPVYNTVRYLDECLRSVCNQSFRDWECILVDDGSTDGSGGLCDAWAEKDTRIRVLHQPNKGVSAARNAGLEEARGQFVAFLDSDDWLTEDCLQRLFDRITSEKTGMSLCGFFYDQDGRSVPSLTTIRSVTIGPEDAPAFADLNRHFQLSVPVAKLYRADLIQEHHLRFDETCSFGEDLLFNYAYLDHILKIAIVPACLYHYRQRAGSLSHRTDPERFQRHYDQWKIQRAFCQQKGLWLASVRRLFFSQLWGYIYDALFLFPLLDKKSTSYLRSILRIPEIDQLAAYPDLFDCSPWIKYAILHRQAWLFRLYFALR